jgi:hypothetical protein
VSPKPWDDISSKPNLNKKPSIVLLDIPVYSFISETFSPFRLKVKQGVKIMNTKVRRECLHKIHKKLCPDEEKLKGKIGP